MAQEQELIPKIRKRADLDNLPQDHELRLAANELEQACEVFNIPKIVGKWAKARRLWSQYSGEPLL